MKKLLILLAIVALASVVAWQGMTIVASQASTELDNTGPAWLPQVGRSELTVVSPSVLMLTYVDTRTPGAADDPAGESEIWKTPPLEQFRIVSGNRPLKFLRTGFKRRVAYARHGAFDLRISNRLYFIMDRPVTDGASVRIEDPAHELGLEQTVWETVADPLRLSSVIHVSQAGYAPEWPKKAAIGYYLGTLGEWTDIREPGFSVINTATGVTVFTGRLNRRTDAGYDYAVTPYQQVWEADFSGLTAPGVYRLIAPGAGASIPFRIHPGAAGLMARTYALGLYHQRCGASNELPFSRFAHKACHLAPAGVPGIDNESVNRILHDMSEGADTTSVRLSSLRGAYYPYGRQGAVDVQAGHHDAGDYSKYTMHSAQFIHQLVFAADALTGVGDLDNLGLPESGDGIGDLLQIARWEAGFLSRMQDTDGGFYFLVYPRDRKYESNVLPDRGDPQVVYPKNTAAAAAAVAALAQIGSSGRFRAAYPEEADAFAGQARKGWEFLMAAQRRIGADRAYQRITHYGDSFGDADEMVWAAVELFLATGAPEYRDFLTAAFRPADRSTRRWGWWRLYEGYGNAIRSYAFAVRSGRIDDARLDPLLSAACRDELLKGGDDQAAYAHGNAYGCSFPFETKRFKAAGWFMAMDAAFDIVTAYELSPTPERFEAILTNAYFEAGVNPVDRVYVTGLGAVAPVEIVHQYALNDERFLPPSGIPAGNIRDGFEARKPYGKLLAALSIPSDAASDAPYPFYDRFSDTFNTRTEATIVKQARALAGHAFLMARSPLKQQIWRAATANIVGLPDHIERGASFEARLNVPGVDLSEAVVFWERPEAEPVSGPVLRLKAERPGASWIEVEAFWPDGRRVVARKDYRITWW